MISSHILDTSLGLPAENVSISLEIKDSSGQWQSIGAGQTNSDGRISFDCPKKAGSYRLLFGIEDYYRTKNIESFFLDTSIVFQVQHTDRKYHVPLLLNPYGYTTYRGS